MPVKASKDRKSATLTCATCGTSATFPASSRAAPELTACEKAHEQAGWAYTIGFQAMMFGHDVQCPACHSGAPGYFLPSLEPP